MSSFPVLEPQLDITKHIHIIAIGGSGMSAIAQVLLGRGFRVSGSDMHSSKFLTAVQKMGARVHIGHDASHVKDADLVLISSAIPESNPEVVAARLAGTPVLKRSQFLGMLMAGAMGIAVAGTHGKTTTTSMIAQVLVQAELDPTVIVGGIIPSLGSNARTGQGKHFVVEACEYDRMFLGLKYEMALINNLEHDHPDIYGTEAEYVDAFEEFANRTPQHGHLIVNGDDVLTAQIVADVGCTVYRVGLSEKSGDLWAEEMQLNQLGGMHFLVVERGNLIGDVQLQVPGRHNVRNALMTIAASIQLGVNFTDIRKALADFPGVARRFEELGTIGNITMIDDYAHHPTAIKETLMASRQRFTQRTIWAVWQPHTYTRVKLLFDDFTEAFDDADKVVVLDICGSRERNTLGMSSDLIVGSMAHQCVAHVGTIEKAAAYILNRITPNDVVLTLGAGDGNRVGALILEELAKAHIGEATTLASSGVL